MRLAAAVIVAVLLSAMMAGVDGNNGKGRRGHSGQSSSESNSDETTEATTPTVWLSRVIHWVSAVYPAYAKELCHNHPQPLERCHWQQSAPHLLCIPRLAEVERWEDSLRFIGVENVRVRENVRHVLASARVTKITCFQHQYALLLLFGNVD